MSRITGFSEHVRRADLQALVFQNRFVPVVVETRKGIIGDAIAEDVLAVLGCCVVALAPVSSSAPNRILEHLSGTARRS